MNKLTKINILKNVRAMRESAQQVQEYLKHFEQGMKDTDRMLFDKLETDWHDPLEYDSMSKSIRFVNDMNKFLGMLENELQK